MPLKGMRHSSQSFKIEQPKLQLNSVLSLLTLNHPSVYFEESIHYDGVFTITSKTPKEERYVRLENGEEIVFYRTIYVNDFFVITEREEFQFFRPNQPIFDQYRVPPISDLDAFIETFLNNTDRSRTFMVEWSWWI